MKVNVEIGKVNPNNVKHNVDVTKLTLDQRQREFLEKDFFSISMRVPDVWRYNYRKGAWTLKEIDAPIYVCCSTYKDYPLTSISDSCSSGSIVLLLESPHRDEYCFDPAGNYKPVAPAQGKTGENISKYLLGKIREAVKEHNIELKKEQMYPVIIANPIQWQTSLAYFYSGSLIEELRDQAWKSIWDLEFIQKDFLIRLEIYNPVLIINACTRGIAPSCKDNLNTLVQKSIPTKYQKIIHTTVHPVVWNMKQKTLSTSKPK